MTTARPEANKEGTSSTGIRSPSFLRVFISSILNYCNSELEKPSQQSFHIQIARSRDTSCFFLIISTAQPSRQERGTNAACSSLSLLSRFQIRRFTSTIKASLRSDFSHLASILLDSYIRQTSRIDFTSPFIIKSPGSSLLAIFGSKDSLDWRQVQVDPQVPQHH